MMNGCVLGPMARPHAWVAAGVAVALAVGAPVPASAGQLKEEIRAVERTVQAATSYLGDYPSVNNNPDPVRRRFLGIEPSNGGNCILASRPPGHELATAVDKLVDLSWRATDGDDRERVDDLLNQAVQLALQGWVLSGNVALLEGLRVSYPRIVSGEQAWPDTDCEEVPFDSFQRESFEIPSAAVARSSLLYDEGIRVLLASLRRRAFNDRPVVVDLDTSPISPEDAGLADPPFDNARFPRYTYFIDRGARGPADDRVVPIQTQGHLMANLLEKQGQATQTLGYRLWTGAYSGTRDPDERSALLEGAVEELQTGAHTQFLAAAALAATAADEASETAQSPYVVNGLHRTRTHVQQARDVIESILADEKPTLAIDEILAGDEQIKFVSDSLAGTGPGSIADAEQKYEDARKALFLAEQSAEAVFRAEEQRQVRFLDSLETLTGVPINESAGESDGVSRDEVVTVAGQSRYLNLVRVRIDGLMSSSNLDLFMSDAGPSNRLDEAVKQVAYHVLEVRNAKAKLDRYSVSGSGIGFCP